MMGVSEVADPVDDEGGSRLRALPALVRSVVGLVWRAGRLDRDVAAFTARFEEAMEVHPRDLHTPPMALLDVYADLERRLLWSWSTPIVNDFFVMIFHGLLRSLCTKWIPEGEDLHNGLLAGEGGLLSAAPAIDGLKLAGQIRERTEWRVLFDSDLSDAEVYAASAEVPSLRTALDAYLEEWGDRCADELKLEVPTLRHRPGLLIERCGPTSQDPLSIPATQVSKTSRCVSRGGACLAALSGTKLESFSGCSLGRDDGSPIARTSASPYAHLRSGSRPLPRDGGHMHAAGRFESARHFLAHHG